MMTYEKRKAIRSKQCPAVYVLMSPIRVSHFVLGFLNVNCDVNCDMLQC